MELKVQVTCIPTLVPWVSHSLNFGFLHVCNRHSYHYDLSQLLNMGLWKTLPLSLGQPRKLPKDWWSGTPITENQPAFITGLSPRGRAVAISLYFLDCRLYDGMEDTWEGLVQPGQWECLVSGVWRHCAWLSGMKEFQFLTGLSSLGQWESWAWKEASCLGLHSQWVVAQGCLALEPVALSTEQPSPTGHEIRHVKVFPVVSGMVGG